MGMGKRGKGGLGWVAEIPLWILVVLVSFVAITIIGNAIWAVWGGGETVGGPAVMGERFGERVRVIDCEAGVICWKVSGVDCLPMAETLLEWGDVCGGTGGR